MRNNMNREGMTFEEWVCAAGVAIYNRVGDDFVVQARRSSYAKEHRTAWARGEDPSEYRKECKR